MIGKGLLRVAPLEPQLADPFSKRFLQSLLHALRVCRADTRQLLPFVVFDSSTGRLPPVFINLHMRMTTLAGTRRSDEPQAALREVQSLRMECRVLRAAVERHLRITFDRAEFTANSAALCANGSPLQAIGSKRLEPLILSSGDGVCVFGRQHLCSRCQEEEPTLRRPSCGRPALIEKGNLAL